MCQPHEQKVLTETCDSDDKLVRHKRLLSPVQTQTFTQPFGFSVLSFFAPGKSLGRKHKANVPRNGVKQKVE